MREQDGAGKGDAQNELRRGEAAFAERVKQHDDAADDGQQDGLPVEQQDEQKIEQHQDDAEDDSGGDADLAPHQRAVAGTLDMAVEIAVGEVVEDAAGGVGQPGTEQENADGVRGRATATCQLQPP